MIPEQLIRMIQKELTGAPAPLQFLNDPAAIERVYLAAKPVVESSPEHQEFTSLVRRVTGELGDYKPYAFVTNLLCVIHDAKNGPGKTPVTESDVVQAVAANYVQNVEEAIQ
jgi:hypothetical protein